MTEISSAAPGSQPSRRRLYALVLAGSRTQSDPVAHAGRKSVKAFVEIDGRPMVERVLDTLRQTGRFDSLLVALPAALPVEQEAPSLARWLATGAVRMVVPGCSPSDSVLKAREQLPTPNGRDVLLVTTGDHPLLTAQAVGQFLDAFLASSADAGAGLVGTDAILHRYPGNQRTAIRCRGGPISGCNLFAFRGEAGFRVVEFWKLLEAKRKQPLLMARAIGLRTCLAYALGLLTLETAIARLGRRAGAQLLPVHLDDIHAGIDVDSLADLELVESIIRTSGNPRRS